MLAMAPGDEKPDVLSSLPRTRPQRRSAKRDAPRKPAAAATAAKKPRPAAKKAAPAAKRAPAKPRPKIEAAAPKIPPAGFAPPRDQQQRPAPTGVELVGTAIQAAGELVQIGTAIGGQALKSALSRLGRG
jgi:hypothetical protein